MNDVTMTHHQIKIVKLIQYLDEIKIAHSERGVTYGVSAHGSTQQDGKAVRRRNGRQRVIKRSH